MEDWELLKIARLQLAIARTKMEIADQQEAEQKKIDEILNTLDIKE